MSQKVFCCRAELCSCRDSAPCCRESPTGHAPHLPIGPHGSGTAVSLIPAASAPALAVPPPFRTSRPLPPLPPSPPLPSRRSRLSRLPRPRPLIPPLRARLPAPPRPRPLLPPRVPPLLPPITRECGRSCRPPRPPRPLCRHSGAGAGPSPVAAAASLPFPAAPGSAVPSAPGAAALRPQRPCARCRGSPPPPPWRSKSTQRTPSCPRAPPQGKRPRQTPSLPAFGRNPPVPARHGLRWDRGAPARTAPPVPAPRRLHRCPQPLPCLRPLQRSLCRACGRSSPASRQRRPCRPPPPPPLPQQTAAASTPLLPPPATPGSSPAEEGPLRRRCMAGRAAPSAPRPPASELLDGAAPPLHGWPSRAFRTAAPRFRAAGWRGSAASCNHGRPGVPFHSRSPVPAAPPPPAPPPGPPAGIRAVPTLP
ncbi:uncharacterized protein [Molothrus aeneus]|uniref:uncharacterized protein n=1 Tax=Molothrus aeneus TaxID=84833 RepID=UPI003458ADE8